MIKRITRMMVFGIALSGMTLEAQSSNYWVSSLIGSSSGMPVGGGNDGIGTSASLGLLQGGHALLIDKSGNLLFFDSDSAIGNCVFRKVTPSGVATAIAGGPIRDYSQGYQDGIGANATFGWSPQPASKPAIDSSNNIYFFDQQNNGSGSWYTLRKITPSGVVSTIAGAPNPSGVGQDGIGTNASFGGLYYGTTPTIDSSNNIYFFDQQNNGSGSWYTLRKITSSGVVSTIAGGPNPNPQGYQDGSGTNASFGGLYYGTTPTIDSSNNIYFFDQQNNSSGSWPTLRKITLSGVVSTIAGGPNPSGVGQNGIGTNASFGGFYSYSPIIDSSNNIYAFDSQNNDSGSWATLRKITPSGVVSTIAGGQNPNSQGYQDGSGTNASFNYSTGVQPTIDSSNNIYFFGVINNTNSWCYTLRKITPAGVVSTIAGGQNPNFQGYQDGLGFVSSINNNGEISGLIADPFGSVFFVNLYSIRMVAPLNSYHVEKNGSSVTIYGYNGIPSGDIVMPAGINGLPVTAIGDSAFAGYTGITSLTIPSGVTSIGLSSFAGCSGLTSVTLPDSITSIGMGAFTGCSQLTAVHASSDLQTFLSSAAGELGLNPQAASNFDSSFLGSIASALSSLPSFIQSCANAILGANNNYGLATKTDLAALTLQTSPTNSAYVRAVATNPTFISALVSQSSFLNTTASNATFVSSLTTNQAFVTAVATQILSGSNNYGLAVKQAQSLSFPAIPTLTITPGKKYTNTVTANTALPVTQIVGNTAIATVSNNVLTILGAGSTTVTASQAGTNLWNPVTASQPLIVNKGAQTLAFTPIPTQTFSPFKTVTLKATSSAALNTNTSYLIDNGAIGTISNNVLLLLGKGTATITATNSGTTYFAPAFATQKLIVK